jgi:hypothetical protein
VRAACIPLFPRRNEDSLLFGCGKSKPIIKLSAYLGIDGTVKLTVIYNPEKQQDSAYTIITSFSLPGANLLG